MLNISKEYESLPIFSLIAVCIYEFKLTPSRFAFSINCLCVVFATLKAILPLGKSVSNVGTGASIPSDFKHSRYTCLEISASAIA